MDNIAQLFDITYRCLGCGTTKPITAFRKDAQKPRRHNTLCQECVARRSVDRYAANQQRRAARIAAGERQTCSTCGESKLIADFPSERGLPGGASRRCLECGRVYQRNRRADDQIRLKYNSRNRLRIYGLSEAAFLLILESQGGACGICRRLLDPQRTRETQVDHDHRTGKVRGILCHRCNPALGQFDDRIELFEAAITYLKKHQ